MEQLLFTVFAMVYLTSLLPILLSYSSKSALLGSLACPTMFHTISFLSCLLRPPEMEAFRGSLAGGAAFHGIMAACCLALGFSS